MCEPCTSVIQYPAEESKTGESNETKMKRGLGEKLSRFMKKVGGFFNLAHLGSGHTESVNWAETRVEYLPPEIGRFEANWWHREFHIDGYLKIEDALADESFKSAEIYTHQICLGDLGKLRNFLEVSINNTEKPTGYLQRMPEMLSLKGQEELMRKGGIILNSLSSSVKNVHSWKYPNYECIWTKLMNKIRHDEANLVSNMLKAFLGLTRKREFLNDAWADSALWSPNK